MVQGMQMVLDIIYPVQQQMRCLSSRRGTSSPSIYACHHWSHFSVHVSPGLWISWLPLCHRWRHRIWSYFSVPSISWETSWLCLWHCLPRLTLQPSPLHHRFIALSTWMSSLLLDFTKLPEDLQSYPWDIESKALSLSRATILTAAHSTPSRGTSSLGDKRKVIPFFSLLTGVLPVSLTSQIFRN